MTETTAFRTLLLPELENELAKTRAMLNALVDGKNEFKPHERSMSLSHLAGHVAEMPEFVVTILTSPDLDIGKTHFEPYRMETKQQAIAHFDAVADALVTAVKQTSDETFQQMWKLSYHGHPIFSGNRYMAYRELGVNHMVHHRAQLGVYLRLLGAKIPGTYGPSADEM